MEQIIKYSPKPSEILNSLFMSTVSTASRTLLSVTSGGIQKWRSGDHFRYLTMLSSWFTMWVLQVLMDYLPFSSLPSPHYFLSGGGLLALGFPSSPPTSTDLVVQDKFDEPSGKAIGRALTHIFGMLNDLPVNSRNYQYAISMAESIVNENMRDGDVAIQAINRSALSSGFSRTTNLLFQSLQRGDHAGGTNAWPTRLLYSLPVFGSYIKSIKSFINLLPIGNKNTNMQRKDVDEFNYESVRVEKYAQELLWLTKKLKYSGAIDEAIVQWSFAYDLATVSLTAKPRVQSIIVLISAILVRELARGEVEVHSEVKFRLLSLWIPLFCYANSGIAHPILSGIEKAEMERALEVVIPTLPLSDQEILLTNWLQDFVYSSTDWPNLQRAYDRWCRTSRKNMMENMMDGAEQLESSIYKPTYT